MFLGGAITWDPTLAKNSTTAGDTTLDEAELKKGFNDPSSITDSTVVEYNNKKYTWAELKKVIQKAMNTKGAFGSADNLSPAEMNATIATLVKPVLDLSDQVENLISELKGMEEDAAHASGADKATAESAIRAKRADLLAKQALLRTAIKDARNAGISKDSISAYRNSLRTVSRATPGGRAGAPAAAGSAAPRSGGSGAGTGAGGTGKAQGQNSGSGNGFGIPGLGNGSVPPNSAAYAAALYNDSYLSDGLASLFKSRREGQKLMMMFFHFARMAESGDLGAMYQLMKFINYVIAKDKARQNIKISSKLIQLQDLSRKSTELLMQTPTDGDPSQVNDFTKAMHRARSQEQSISTSQKLLADMLQEFAHVVEALTNSTKFMLDAWGRVMRTASRPS